MNDRSMASLLIRLQAPANAAPRNDDATASRAAPERAHLAGALRGQQREAEARCSRLRIMLRQGAMFE